ncbi:MAG: hypothetical protein SPI97_01565, partial [Oscillospiraceae bacterium]|nr:hypothetical protein [Oscillospiraceae bacterium]
SLPEPLVFSLACLIEYYKTNEVQDKSETVAFIKDKNVTEILSNTALWGMDLSIMKDMIEESIEKIHNKGIREAIQWSMS